MANDYRYAPARKSGSLFANRVSGGRPGKARAGPTVNRVPALPCVALGPASSGRLRHFSPYSGPNQLLSHKRNARVARFPQSIFREKSRKVANFCTRMADKKAEKDGSVPLPISVSQALYGYLGYLSRHTQLGQKETDVARFLLTERLNQMVRTKEHEKLKPPEDAAR
jgi:hypothetical protein